MNKKQTLSLTVNNQSIHCNLRWNKKAKRIILKVIHNELVLTLPSGVSSSEGMQFVQKQANWIGQHIDTSLASYNHLETIEQLLFNGELLLFQMKQSDRKTHRVVMEDNKIVLLYPKVTSQEKQKTALKSFLRKMAIAKFEERFSVILGSNTVPTDVAEKFNHLRVRFLKGSFGLCYPKDGTIVLNVELVQYANDLIDYVIYHELAHFRHANHSKDFYAMMEYFVPKWKERKLELNKLHTQFGGW